MHYVAINSIQLSEYDHVLFLHQTTEENSSLMSLLHYNHTE